MRRISVFVLIAAAIPAWSAQPVRARHGMVVSRETHATEAGVKILEAGGNAVDAAVAVGFALAVTHPSAGNIGGGGFMLIRLADGRTTFIDFRERAPQAASHDMYLDAAGKLTRDSTTGWRASGVPGTVRGMEYASKKYGKLAWARTLEPAIELAAQGYALSYAEANGLRSQGLSAFPESEARLPARRQVLRGRRDLRPARPGAHAQPHRRLGQQDFYEGETAHELAADMAFNHGTITLKDLEDYKAVERKPLTGKYHGYDIITAPPPSSGGVGILQMLGMLEGTGYEKAGAGSASVVHYMAEAMRRFFADRSEYMGDPDFVKVPDRRHARSRLHREAARFHRSRARHAQHADQARHVSRATKSTETTHYTVVDAEGNAVVRDIHLERRLRQRRHRPRPGLPAEQRDGRFRRQARRTEYVRPDPGRSQRHRARQDGRSRP